MTANKKMRTAVYIGIAALLLLLNCLTPMVGDDYQYGFIFNRPERLESLADVFYSQYIHYFEWGAFRGSFSPAVFSAAGEAGVQCL